MRTGFVYSTARRRRRRYKVLRRSSSLRIQRYWNANTLECDFNWLSFQCDLINKSTGLFISQNLSRIKGIRAKWWQAITSPYWPDSGSTRPTHTVTSYEPTWRSWLRVDVCTISLGLKFAWYTTKTSNIRRALLTNRIVDCSDVVGASPVGAAPTTTSFST